jgi:hypothetical protein
MFFSPAGLLSGSSLEKGWGIVNENGKTEVGQFGISDTECNANALIGIAGALARNMANELGIRKTVRPSKGCGRGRQRSYLRVADPKQPKLTPYCHI